MNKNINQEIWLPVRNYEDRYLVSNTGNVKSLKHNKILKPWKSPDGHLIVYLCKNKTKVSIGIHRLVLLTFVGEPLSDFEASHLDGNEENNNLENLAWESHATNMRRRIEHNTTNKSKVLQCDIDKMKVLYTQGNSFRKIGRQFNMTHNAVANLIRKY